jgi:CBS domain-containing protein/gamma-glutamylcysteine synthetase
MRILQACVMGELNVRLATDKRDTQLFVKHLLRDTKALERMIAEDWFESDIVRIGAEQELCLVNRHAKPAPINLEVIASASNEAITSELARFNLEYNLQPREFRGDCLRALEQEIRDLYEIVREHAARLDAEPVMAGILPTIRKFDVGPDSLTPLDRYRALMTALNTLRTDDLELNIRGVDELRIKHDSPLLEGCNTGFQVHLQVHPSEFACLYNIAQLITAPVLAVSAFSPMLFGKRLWYETRVALFQQSIDTRTSSEYLRHQSPRVLFGNRWVRRSLLELYHEDITRHRVLLSTDIDENVFAKLREGITPKLRALSVHNGTVYRWNRPCYGISPNGKPHLRIENRILPAGPSIVDEMASAAFWLGLMKGMQQEIGDPSALISFDEVGHNFLAAARTGITSKFNWIGAKQISVSRLVLHELLPLARIGLERMQVDAQDTDRYLGIIEERVRSERTGAQWMLNSYMALSREGRSQEDVLRSITANLIRRQKADEPVHTWELASDDPGMELELDSLLIEEIMVTDVYTVQPDDIVELVAEMMDWNRIRYMPVENEKGELEGLITSRILLRHFSSKHLESERRKPVTVRSLMITDLLTAEPEEPITRILDLMREKQIGCVPVVKNRKLVGIVTQGDFVNITAGLINSVVRRKVRR